MDSELLKIRNTKDGRILKKSGYVDLEKNDDNEADIDEKVVQEIIKFMKSCPICPKPKKRKRICNKDVYYLRHSYGLKHIFSKFLKHPYCSNGEFIAA